jgi:hypothetical protein
MPQNMDWDFAVIKNDVPNAYVVGISCFLACKWQRSSGLIKDMMWHTGIPSPPTGCHTRTWVWACIKLHGHHLMPCTQVPGGKVVVFTGLLDLLSSEQVSVTMRERGREWRGSKEQGLLLAVSKQSCMASSWRTPSTRCAHQQADYVVQLMVPVSMLGHPPQELAAVLAHETAHVLARHHVGADR